MILDTFYILYKTNAKEVKKDSKDAEKATDDLESHIKNTDKQTQSLGLSFSKAIAGGVAAIATFDALRSLEGKIWDSVSLNAQFEKMSRLTGESAAQLSAWDAAVVEAGGSAGEFSGWITQLNQQFVNLGMGNRTPQVLQNLRNLSKEWRDTGKSMAQMLALGARFHIPPDIVLLMAKGPEKMDEIINRYEKLQHLTDENAQASRDFETAVNRLSEASRGAFTQLAGPLVHILHLFTAITSTIGNVIDSFHYLFGELPSDLGAAAGDAAHRLLFGDKNVTHSNNATGAESISQPNGPLTRGIRNNNPGNLVFAGQSGAVNAGGFAAFPTMAAGVHAEERQLELYGQRGLDTLAKIAAKWAPASENDLPAYIRNLAARTGFGASEHLDLTNPEVVRKIANAINANENGAQYGAMISAAHEAIKMADNSPLNSQNGGDQTHVSFGGVTINVPPGSDGKQIADAFKQNINDHFRATIGNYDDGVMF